MKSNLIVSKHEISAREQQAHHWDMKYNLSMPEILSRYVMMALLVIIGGVTHSLILQLIALPVFLTAILGWSPLYQILGINHGSAPKTNKQYSSRESLEAHPRNI